MTTMHRKQSESGFYHVMARGVGKAIIYEDDADRTRFLELLSRLTRESKVGLYAWCLMDNHYHILVQGDLGDISELLQLLNGTYARYFNERHGRSGHLFQGRFESEAIDTDSYFLTVLRYIHQNPLRACISSTESYPWSSYREYSDTPWICNTDFGLSLLGGSRGFIAFHRYVDESAVCVDIHGSRKSMSTEMLLDIARCVLGNTRPEDVAGVNRQQRNDGLRTLKEAQLSLRQIERITGVSKSVVARA